MAENEYIIQKDTLTGIADEVRTMSGTSDVMSTSNIKMKLATANEEIDTQSDLISQITSALQGKAVGGGGSGSGSSELETCSITFNVSGSGSLSRCYAYTRLLDGVKNHRVNVYFDAGGGTTWSDIVKGTIIVVYSNSKSYKVSAVEVGDGLTLLTIQDGTAIIAVNDDCPDTSTLTATFASA